MIKLTNKHTGQTKHVPTGVSWTSLFFGVFVPLFRGDMKNFTIGLAVYVLGGAITAGILPLLYWAYMVLKYNEMYLNDLLRSGWVVTNESI